MAEARLARPREYSNQGIGFSRAAIISKGTYGTARSRALSKLRRRESFPLPDTTLAPAPSPLILTYCSFKVTDDLRLDDLITT